MAKHYHEIRDPIHIFIRLDTDERKVLDSYPFQRLRYIHQLAMSYLVYPGATHRRFEHSLGVMELADRIFSVVTNPDNVHPKVKEVIPEITQIDKLSYWRRALRMAALCHDLGHLPFSHAAEEALLPEGWDHERLTMEFIRSSEMKKIWEEVTPPLRTEDIVKLAVGPKKNSDVKYTNWEAILSEIIVGDSFGADRIDYLLRDSHHAGVAYGKFDHFRLIDTLRILPKTTGEDDGSVEPALGIEGGGIHSAEALLLARYFMYSQVYFHPVRRAYDIHLKDFLILSLPGGKFPTDVEKLKFVTDNEVLSELLHAAMDSSTPGYDPARRIIKREHFKLLYQKNPDDIKLNPEACKVIFTAVKERFGDEMVRRDNYPPKGGLLEFPVLYKDGRITTAYNASETLKKLPAASFDYILLNPVLVQEGIIWLRKNRPEILKNVPEEE
ncbi:MAG: HD domain-containing protein [Bacillota bacterium]